MKTVAERLIERCSRPGGASRHELIMYVDRPQRPVARQRLEELLQTGQLFRFKRPAAGGRGNPAQQYFTNQQEGERWAASTAIKPRNPVRKKPPHPPTPITISAKPKAGPVLAAGAEVVVPAGLRPTVLQGMPAFDPRFQVDPSTRVVGGFASLGPGRYLDGKV